jgi:hypothetical protein
MKIYPVMIKPDILQVHKPDTFTFINKQTGAIITKYKIQDERIPYILYHDGNKTLTIQVSIPKLLYGNNVKLINEADIPTFFDELQQRLKQLFHIQIKHADWKVIRLDVCWNFGVGNRVHEYTQNLGKIKVPYKDTRTHNHDQTVEYRNKSSRTILYNKEIKSIRDKEPVEIITQSKGILRLEVKPSSHEMKKYSKDRKAVELLTSIFFESITSKALKELKYPIDEKQIDYQWLVENKNHISKIETLLGYNLIKQMFDENIMKEIYKPATLANRKRLQRSMTIPTTSCLEPLQIDYLNIG